jgi:Ca2+-binding RTX toxin-like protein
MNANGSNATNLTNNTARDNAPDWKPACTINGTTGDDVGLNGGPGNEVICGLGGNDEINASGGNDVVVGAEGNDTIKRGGGRDRVFGGFGDDVLSVKDGVRRNDVVDGGEGTDMCKSDCGDRKVSCEQ